MEFLTRGWFWMVLGGAVLTAAAGAVGTTRTSRWWLVPAVLGLVLTMTGILLLFRPRFRFAELGTAQLRLVIGAGVVSGIIAFLVASFIEGRLEPRMHVPFAVDLWLAGVIEETCKLAVPVLLLTGPSAHRDLPPTVDRRRRRRHLVSRPPVGPGADLGRPGRLARLVTAAFSA